MNPYILSFRIQNMYLVQYHFIFLYIFPLVDYWIDDNYQRFTSCLLNVQGATKASTISLDVV